MPLMFCDVCLSSYHSALSEMAVHAYCKGAVMILGKPDNNQSQVSSHVQYNLLPKPSKFFCFG